MDNFMQKPPMTLILNIDTATESASICLSGDGKALAVLENNNQRDHAAWLHVAITQILQETGFSLKDLAAVAVVSGPGSYTGLRVGLASAKGFCYALRIPLITEISLKSMAFAAREQGVDPSFLLCPMLDARRMEVFTAVYNYSLEELLPPSALILDENSFCNQLKDSNILFFGGGSKKWQSISQSPNAFFEQHDSAVSFFGILSYQKFIKREFTDIIYSEPVYTKEFYTHTKK
jgi:tRNA threonylcarbamoyladenosine biosynthesis protein TsaB